MSVLPPEGGAAGPAGLPGWTPAAPPRLAAPVATPAPPTPTGPAAVDPWSAQRLAPPPAPPTTPGGRRGEPDYDQAQPYHRVLRTRSYRPWRPAVGLLVMIGTFLVVSTAITLATLLPTVLTDPDPALSSDELVGDIVSTPLGLLGVNLSLAVLIPAAMLGLLAGHQIRAGFLHSVVGRFRWGFLGLCLLVEGVVWLLTLPLTALLAGDTEAVPTPGEVGGLSFAQWLPFALVILLTTPLQAAGEEYGFRGYGMQALGAWVRSPWFAIAVTSVLFAFAHGTQSLPLFLDRLAFGVVAGLLTVRTGGLEAAIAFHVVNNMIILLLASAAGQLEPSLTVSEAPWGLVVADVAGMVLYTVVVLWLARRRGLLTSTAPTPAAWAPPPWTSVVAPAAPG